MLKRPTPRPPLLRKQMRVRPGRDADASVESSVDADATADMAIPALGGEGRQFRPLMKKKTRQIPREAKRKNPLKKYRKKNESKSKLSYGDS
jgi:hypothetical protein